MSESKEELNQQNKDTIAMHAETIRAMEDSDEATTYLSDLIIKLTQITATQASAHVASQVREVIKHYNKIVLHGRDAIQSGMRGIQGKAHMRVAINEFDAWREKQPKPPPPKPGTGGKTVLQ